MILSGTRCYKGLSQLSLKQWFTMSFVDMLFPAFAVGLLSLLTLIFWQFVYWRRRGIPYLTPLPIVGHNPAFTIPRMPVTNAIEHTYSRCPTAKYVGVMDFFTPMILLRDPELLREMCIKNFEHFPNHNTFITESMDPMFGKNLFSLRDELWKDMRSVLSPSFTASKMRFMFQLMTKCSQDFVGYLLDHPEQTKSMEMKDALSRYTNDVIVTTAFGITVDSMQDRKNEFHKHGRAASMISNPFQLVKLLLFRACPSIMRKFGFEVLTPDAIKFFVNLVSDTVKIRDEQGIVRPDFMHLLMQARKKGNGNITDEAMVAQAFIFFLAGFETSSTMMNFMVYEMAINQDMQKRLREEVDRLTSESGGEITYEMLQEMKYMDMVISETLRKYPPIPLIDRICSKEFILPPALPGYKELLVKPGAAIWLPIYGIHRDPRFFSDPEKFDPERFSDENKSKIVPGSYLPFGFGPRSCIAVRFALMESKIVLAALLKKFIFKPNDKTTIPFEFCSKAFSMLVKDGCWLQLEERVTLQS